MNPLVIALTKGRLQKKTVELFEKAGFDCAVFSDPGRKLVLEMPDAGAKVVLAKAADVVTYVDHGVCDIGVVGKDTILEAGRSLYEVMDLGFGKCRFALAVKEGEDFFAPGKYRRRVASKYPAVAARYFLEQRMDVEIIKIEGSVELAPLLGLADGIVDLVETGQTLRENGLVIARDILPVSARMVVNLASMKMRKQEILNLLDRLKGAMEG